jgi:hypothetical protein
MSDVYQCTMCELRFLNRAELKMHQGTDHPSQDPEPEPEPVYDDDGGGRVEE